MGSYYASCGHEISFEELDSNAKYWESYERCGCRSLSYGVLCSNCIEKDGYELVENEKEFHFGVCNHNV